MPVAIGGDPGDAGVDLALLLGHRVVGARGQHRVGVVRHPGCADIVGSLSGSVAVGDQTDAVEQPPASPREAAPRHQVVPEDARDPQGPVDDVTAYQRSRLDDRALLRRTAQTRLDVASRLHRATVGVGLAAIDTASHGDGANLVGTVTASHGDGANLVGTASRRARFGVGVRDGRAHVGSVLARPDLHRLHARRGQQRAILGHCVHAVLGGGAPVVNVDAIEAHAPRHQRFNDLAMHRIDPQTIRRCDEHDLRLGIGLANGLGRDHEPLNIMIRRTPLPAPSCGFVAHLPVLDHHPGR